MTLLRHFLSRKTWFYGVVLPMARRLGPAGGDALLGRLGRLVPLKGVDRARLGRASDRLGADWDLEATSAALRANGPRFAARDYLLSGLSDAEALRRFHIEGLEHLDAARGAGRGVVLLGSHFGAYMPAFHWLARVRMPIRLLVQRPHHVSPELAALFDAEAEHPQRAFFLKRGMPADEGARRVWHARAILRDGMALAVNGDVAWPSGCARRGRLLGVEQGFLGVWADLAVLTGAAVVPYFARHLPEGRYTIRFDVPWSIGPGDESAAVAAYLSRLEREIRAHPAEAVAHLTWPSFADSRAEPAARSTIGQALAISRSGPTPV